MRGQNPDLEDESIEQVFEKVTGCAIKSSDTAKLK